MKVAYGALLALLLLGVVSAHSAEEWKNRTIYQLLTDRFNNGKKTPCDDLSVYCGGTFEGIIEKLDYIEGMGFDAIWISPVVENTENGYHGYWAKNFYKISPQMGGEAGLKKLVAACHERNIWVMVDIVLNHVGPVGTDFSSIYPFNQSAYYHPQCDVTEYTCFTNEVLTCRLAGLPDLDQSNKAVRTSLMEWGSWLVKKFNIDGIRADTVMYIDKDFWHEFNLNVGVYLVGEVFADLDCNAQYNTNGIDGTLSYPLFFTMRNVYQQSQSMYQIQSTVQAYKTRIPHPEYLATFIDNHDQDRFLCSNADEQKYLSAIVYTLFSTGIPVIYYGTEQSFSGCSDPKNREPLWTSGFRTTNPMYQSIKELMAIRRKMDVASFDQVEQYVLDGLYAFSRGKTLVLTSNNNQDISVTIPNLPYAAGSTICNQLTENVDGDCIIVNGDYSASITLEGGKPKIYIPSSKKISAVE